MLKGSRPVCEGWWKQSPLRRSSEAERVIVPRLVAEGQRVRWWIHLGGRARREWTSLPWGEVRYRGEVSG